MEKFVAKILQPNEYKKEDPKIPHDLKDERYYNPNGDVAKMTSSEVSNNLIIHPEVTGQNIYDAGKDATNNNVGSRRDSAVSTSSRLFNYLTSTPGFLMLTANNYQFFLDAGVTLYSPTRIFNPEKERDGEICINELGMIASMQIVEKGKAPTVDNFIKYTTLNNNDETNGRTDIVNPNFLFYVKLPVDRNAIGRAQSAVSGRELKQATITSVGNRDTGNPIAGADDLKSYPLSVSNQPTFPNKNIDTELNMRTKIIIQNLLNAGRFTLDFTDLLKNDRYLSFLMNKLKFFDIYEQTVDKGEKTYKGILTSVNVTCPKEGIIAGFGSSNLKIILSVRKWVKSVIDGKYKIEEESISVDVDNTGNYPKYIANIYADNHDTLSRSAELMNNSANSIESNNFFARQSFFEKQSLQQLDEIMNQPNDSGLVKPIKNALDSYNKNIKVIDDFVKFPDNPFVYKFSNEDVVQFNNRRREYLLRRDCYEIGKTGAVKWLGQFDGVTKKGEASFVKNYNGPLCASKYQFNFSNGPNVICLKSVVGATWLDSLKDFETHPGDSAFDQIYKSDGLQVFNQPPKDFPTFYAIKKTKPIIDELRKGFNDTLGKIPKKLDEIVEEINEIIKITHGSDISVENPSFFQDLKYNQKINYAPLGNKDNLGSIAQFFKLYKDTHSALINATTQFSQSLLSASNMSKGNSLTLRNPEELEEYNKIKTEYDLMVQSNQNDKPKNSQNTVRPVVAPIVPNASSEVSVARNNDEIIAGDYVKIVGDLSEAFCSDDSKNVKYAYVVLTPAMGKVNARRRGMKIGTKGYSLIYLKNADDLKSLTGKTPNCTVFDKSLLKKVTRDEVETYLNSLTPVNVGGAKHTRRSHTGPRKNVTRHGNNGLMRRRTSHKGRKRGAHKTAKK